MLQGPACGLLVTCSFRKCLHRLLFFISGNNNPPVSVWIWFSSRTHADEALFTHKYVSGVDDVSAGCAIVTMATCRCRQHPPTSLPPSARPGD